MVFLPQTCPVRQIHTFVSFSLGEKETNGKKEGIDEWGKKYREKQLKLRAFWGVV